MHYITTPVCGVVGHALQNIQSRIVRMSHSVR